MNKVAFITLGCAKNTVLTEYMMGVLKNSDYSTVDSIEDADCIIINTCGFIDDAKEESINTILELSELKRTSPNKKIVALGCLVQKYANDLNASLPEIDLLLGSTEYDNIIEHLNTLKENNEATIIMSNQWPERTQLRGSVEREITTPSDYAYLMISEGCNNHCTYCSIPEMQGPYRSRPMEDIVNEAISLVNKGYKELIIIAQDTTYYGKDIYGEFCLDKLLEQLAKIDSIHWIRLLYAYPNNFTDSLIETMAKHKTICHYIDIPLQHASDSVLKRMNRQITQREIKKLIETLRNKMPDIIIRSTFISGFPGETEEEHQALIQFLEDMKLNRVGVFAYSREDNTVAGKMKNQVEEYIKQERAQELMEYQFDNMVYTHQQLIGKEIEVKIDTIENDLVYTRSYGEAPLVDPYIILKNKDIPNDEYFMVRITEIDGYDMIGEVI